MKKMIDRLLEKPIIAVIILLVLALYLFFFQPGDMGLTDPDETFYAQTAREMLNRGEWFTPYLYDKPQFEKPILFYWLLKVSFSIFGVNEFAARFPSAVLGTIGIIAIYLLGSSLFNKRVGLFSSLILATNVEYIVLSRACVTDMALGTFMLLGILCFFQGRLKEKNHFYLLSAIAFALATLTKGPIAVILPGTVLAVYLFAVKDLKALKKMPIFS
ncbi:MAG: glycosyltransferase family 39 protein, partial [Candidatus Omnitrophica bacterium]|nr:glycosyltransferase family 39 protein [Candidatus Omnitrophota bacterium]